MICPRCYAELDADAGSCPECGVRLTRSVSGVMKTSAVLIAVGEESGFYRSVQDVPEPLRSQLLESTSSANAGTIVIADQAGKESITQVIARREKEREKPAPAADAPPEAAPRRFLGYSWVVWAGVVLLLVAALVIVAVFSIH